MNEAQRIAGTALKTELQPFRKAQGKRLTAVLTRESGRGEELMLVFGTESLVFSCNEDTDTVDVAFIDRLDGDDAEDLTADPVWSRYIGKDFSCGWLMVNQQGYIDGVLLSFDGVVPEIGLNVVASAFETLEIRQQPA